MAKAKRKYGYIPDIPDQRDLLAVDKFKFKVCRLPKEVDLRQTAKMPIYDQLSLGSCVLNAAAKNIQFLSIKNNEPDKGYIPSRLFMYYNTRVIEGHPNDDTGCQIRNAIKAIAKQGSCAEYLWPYKISKFAVKPADKCYTEAEKHKAIIYGRINLALAEMKGCLASGFPFIIGISVYDSFESDEVARTGIVPMPKKSESMLGGHAMIAMGYRDSKKQFIIANSWGTSWGISGYCLIPYDYLTNDQLAADFWAIRKMT